VIALIAKLTNMKIPTVWATDLAVDCGMLADMDSLEYATVFF
jgi:hypothetical protein